MLSAYKPASTPKVHWHCGVVALCVTALLLLGTAYTAFQEYRFTQTAARADGIVIGQNAGRHHVQVKFKTAAGQDIEYPQNGLISHGIGDRVTVLYDPKEPRASAVTGDIGALWGGTMSLSVVSLGLFLLAMLFIFRPRAITIPGASSN